MENWPENLRKFASAHMRGGLSLEEALKLNVFRTNLEHSGMNEAQIVEVADIILRTAQKFKLVTVSDLRGVLSSNPNSLDLDEESTIAFRQLFLDHKTEITYGARRSRSDLY